MNYIFIIIIYNKIITIKLMYYIYSYTHILILTKKNKMTFIFEKLPTDIIKKIVLYNDNFIIRKGEIISIIPKNDYRYKLLSNITLKLNKIYGNNRYNYFFPNLYNYEERTNNNDLFQISIEEKSNGEIKCGYFENNVFITSGKDCLGYDINWE